MGSTKRQRRIAIVGGLWLFVALFVLGGGVALADVGPDVTQAVVDPLDQVTDAVEDTVDEVTDAVDDTVDGVTQAVDDPVDGVTDAVDNTVDGVTQAVDDTVAAVTEATSNAADGAASTAGAAASSATGSVRGEEGQTGSPESETERPSDRQASRPNGGLSDSGAWVPYGLRDPMPASIPGVVAWNGPFGEQGQVEARTDPCEHDGSLVCLGVLYGLGEFADAGTEVLGILVTTGAAVIGLMVLAAGLAVAGAWALVAASSAPGTAGRAV
jgi:hypothetical protein